MLFIGEYALKAAALLGSAFSRAFMIPIAAINALSKAMGLGIQIPPDLGAPLLKLAEDARTARRELDLFSGRSSAEFAATDERRTDIGSIKARKAAGASVGRPVEQASGQAQALASIKEMTAEYQKQQAAIQSKIAFETEFIGKSENEKQLAEAQRKLAEDYIDLQDKLIKKRESLTKDEQKKGVLGKEINNQIKLAAQGFTAQFDALSAVIVAEQTAKLLEEDRKRNLENMTKAMEQQLKIQEALAGARLSIISQGKDTAFAGSKIGKGALQQQMMDIAEANRKAGLEASRAFAAAFEDGGDGLTPERAQQLADGLKAIEEGYAGIAAGQTANLELSRTWATGWD